VKIVKLDADERAFLRDKCAPQDFKPDSDACVKAMLDQVCPGTVWTCIAELKVGFNECNRCYASTPMMVLALADAGYTIAREGDWRPPEKPGYEAWYARYFVAIDARCWRAVKDGVRTVLEGAVVCAPPDSCMEANILEVSGYARTVLARDGAEPAQGVPDEPDDATAPAVDAVGRAWLSGLSP
jgi:hypothetical protein